MLSTPLVVPLLILPIVLLFAFAGCAQILGVDEDIQFGVARYSAVVKAHGLDLLHYWRLDEVAGLAADIGSAPPQPGAYSAATKRGQKGVLQSLGNDPSDLATDFDGTNASVDVAFNPTVNPPLVFSLEAWIKPDLGAVTPQTLYVAAGSFQFAPSAAGFGLGIIAERTAQGVVKPTVARGFVLAGAVGGATIDVPLDPNAGDGWYHVVLTYEKTGAGSTFMLHLNGGARSAVLSSIDYFPVPLGSASPFRIGGPSVPAPGMAFFKGLVDEVALYNVALKPDPKDPSKDPVKDHFMAASAK